MRGLLNEGGGRKLECAVKMLKTDEVPNRKVFSYYPMLPKVVVGPSVCLTTSMKLYIVHKISFNLFCIL